MSKLLISVSIDGEQWEVHCDEEGQLFWQKESQMIGLVTDVERALLKHMNTANSALAGIHNLVPSGKIQGGGWDTTMDIIHVATAAYWGGLLGIDSYTMYHKNIEVLEVEL